MNGDPTMAQMLIANRLGDGRVVFRAADGSWVESIATGLLIDNEPQADRLLTRSLVDVDENLVIDPSLIAVSTQGGRRTPVEIREAIRAGGPTVVVDNSDEEA